jgi:hypothetical protein
MLGLKKSAIFLSNQGAMHQKSIVYVLVRAMKLFGL